MNTAVFERHGKRLLIDSGEIDSIAADWILFTHHHRDQGSAAARLVAAGAKTVVPAKEAALFARADEFWAGVDKVLYHRYSFRPDLFTFRESIPVTRAVRSGDTFEWEGLKFQVLETPGHTDGSVTYFVDIDRRRVAFTGDLICARGKLWELYSLQKQAAGMPTAYVGFGGATVDVKASLDSILAMKPDLLVPSHGEIITEPADAVAALKENLDAMMNNWLSTAGWRVAFPTAWPADKPPLALPSLPAKQYPSWFRDITATTKAILADDGSVFLSDCGSPTVIEKLTEMRGAGEIGPIEAIWITHYHDDHTQSVNAARTRFGPKVYVQREMVDIIENPTAYNMPCLFPESTRVDRVMEDRETIEWKQFKLTSYFFPGQTQYHAGLLVERDGFRLFLTGDSFNNWGINCSTSENRCFIGRNVGYEKCLNVLLEVMPDLLVSAHYGAVPLSADYLKKTIAILQERERLFRKLLPYEDPNFGTDPYWIRAYPYLQSALPGATVQIEARILNHAKRAKKVRVALSLPDGWKPVRVVNEAVILARTEGRIRLAAIAPSKPASRRHVIGLRTEMDRPLGEFAEALVDFLAG